jgi:hypothetical protein
MISIVDHNVPVDFVDFLAMHAEIRDVDAHIRLQNDNIEHLWSLEGNSEARS